MFVMQTVGYAELVKMLRGAAAKIKAGQAALSKLDSVIGDGDHGTTIARAMGLVEKSIGAAKGQDLGGLLNDAGWAVMGVDGGATGPLLGTLLMGMGESAAGKKALDASALAEVFEGGLAAVQKQTPAQVGDKTMIDALAPAVAALRAAAEAGDLPAVAMRKAADAAEQGAASTVNLRARFGRARNLGDRSIGVQDAGATSMAMIFGAMADALA
jgi:dihydroxyacetone kinase-like protein